MGATLRSGLRRRANAASASNPPPPPRSSVPPLTNRCMRIRRPSPKRRLTSPARLTEAYRAQDRPGMRRRSWRGVARRSPERQKAAVAQHSGRTRDKPLPPHAHRRTAHISHCVKVREGSCPAGLAGRAPAPPSGPESPRAPPAPRTARAGGLRLAAALAREQRATCQPCARNGSSGATSAINALIALKTARMDAQTDHRTPPRTS